MTNTIEYKIELKFWKKGMKVECPVCDSKVKEPYICKCGAILKPFVRFKN